MEIYLFYCSQFWSSISTLQYTNRNIIPRRLFDVYTLSAIREVTMKPIIIVNLVLTELIFRPIFLLQSHILINSKLNKLQKT